MKMIQMIIAQTVSLLISLGVIAAFSFIAKVWIKRFIDHFYKMKENQLAVNNELQKEIDKRAIPMSMEFTQIVYKTRNYARELINKNTPLIHEKDEFIQCSSLLTEKLFIYKALLDKDIFDMLHRFKRASQDFVLYLDVSDREELLRKGRLCFSEEMHHKLDDLYVQMDKLQNEISIYFQNRLKAH